MYRDVIRTVGKNVVAIDQKVSALYEPNTLALEISFEGEGDTRQECLEEFSKSFNAVVSVGSRFGFGESNWTASNCTIEALYRYVYREIDGQYEEVVENRYMRKQIRDGFRYEATAELKITQDFDSDYVLKLWMAFAENQADYSFSIQPGLKDQASLEQDLITIAVEEARGRAEKCATAAGCKLGSATYIHTEGNSDLATMSRCADSILEGISYSHNEIEEAFPCFSLAPISLEVEVHTEWELL